MRWSDVMTSGGVYVILAVLCSNVLSAPVLPQASFNDAAPSSPHIENQEQELENLIQLAQSQASQPNTQVQKTHTLTIEEHDGTKMEDHVMEQKVVDPSDGSVVSDIKQEVKEVKSGDGVQPEAVVETEVNIPSAGIDETFVQKADDVDAKEPSMLDDVTNDVTSSEEIGSDDDDSNDEDVDNDDDVEDVDDEMNEGDNGDDVVDDDVEGQESGSIPLTTQDMAEYLLVTQQFDQFLPALERLVDMRKMTVTDAASYAKDVIEEYEKLDMELFRDAMSYDKRTPQDYYPIPYQSMAPQTGDYRYPAYLTPQEQLYLEQQQQQQQMPYLPQERVLYHLPQQQQQQQLPKDFNMVDAGQVTDPLDFLTALYDAAYGKDNAEAQEVIQLLYDRVSTDDNPDDLGQIRDLLVDTLSSSVYNNNEEDVYPNQMMDQVPRGDNLLMAPNFRLPSGPALTTSVDEEDDAADDDDTNDDGVVGDEPFDIDVKRTAEMTSYDDDNDDKVDDKEEDMKVDDDSNDLEDDLENASEEQNSSEKE